MFGVLRAQAHQLSDEPMLEDWDGDVVRRQWTYREVLVRADVTAARLASLGLVAGDRVVLWQVNGVEWVSTFFALARLGVVAVLANTRLRTMDLVHIIDDSRACALVYTPVAGHVALDPLVGELAALRDEGGLANLRHLVATGPTLCDGAIRLDDIAINSGAVVATVTDAERVLLACYTSGSSGAPKGCLHSHATLVRNAREAVGLGGLLPTDRVLCPVPFSHVFGFHMGVIQTVLAGALLINAEPYDAERLVTLAHKGEATVLYAVPTMAREFISVVERRGCRLANLRLALVAGAPVGAGLRRKFTDPDGGLGVKVTVVYGCTEAPTLTQLLPGETTDEPETAVGHPTPGVEIRVVKPGGSELLEHGEVGEVLCRGYNTMVGYLGDPGATAGRFRHGWFATGDLGWVEETGGLHIVGRLSEMILVGGFNVYPAEVAAQLEQMNGVAEVAVVGVPDERLGSVPYAWVIPDKDAPDPISSDDVLKWARETMAGFKRPRYAEVIDALPRTTTNKVSRAELEEMSRAALPQLAWNGGPR